MVDIAHITASHDLYFGCVTDLLRVFDTAAVAEIDVISEMADKHCYSAADSNVSKRRSAHSSSRDHLDKEPALPGEQVH